MSLLILLNWLPTSAQQIPDTSFVYSIGKPAYASGKGPVVTIDEAHFNFHTMQGRYLPFARLLQSDGYQVRAGREPFSQNSLQQTDIFVIANALADDGEWVKHTRQAFTEGEVLAVKTWVEDGGSLLLIADHMPFPGAAENLAKAFGFSFVNGFAIPDKQGLEKFSRKKGNLLSSPVTDKTKDTEYIDRVIIFTGQGFRIPEKAIPFIALDSTYTLLLPERAWEFSDDTPSISGAGHYAGACLEFGKGKIVVMGEAAMFTAQLAGPEEQKMGMNHPEAKENAQLLLNIFHWLD